MTYLSSFGQSAYDVAINTGYGLEGIVQFMNDNKIVEINTAITSGIEFEVKKTVPSEASNFNDLPQNEVGIYFTSFNQTLFDVATQLGVNLESIVAFALNNNLLLDKTLPYGTKITYTKSLNPLQVWVNKNGYSFTTGLTIVTGQGNFILREDSSYLLREDGFKFLREK